MLKILTFWGVGVISIALLMYGVYWVICKLKELKIL